MNCIKLDLSKVKTVATDAKINALKEQTTKANQALEDGSRPGNDFLGWVNLPSEISTASLQEMKAVAEDLRGKSDILVVIGIGGSYLGAKAVIDALSDNFAHLKRSPKDTTVLFAGQNISEDYLVELTALLAENEWSICVISKSGTTTEPAIAFRHLKSELEKKYGAQQAKSRIVAVTDESKGALRELANQEGYKTFVIPDNVGGRFSVLTPVGLIAIAAAGFDIEQLVAGAKQMQELTNASVPFEQNIAAQYAAARNVLYQEGKTTEILANYNPKLHFIAEWWKQLYGESEGKENKGIFPASVDFTADLHSMGQYIQEGLRNIFETVISVNKTQHSLKIQEDAANLDSLNYLAGKNIDEVNKKAELGTTLAHVDGGVPNIKLELTEVNEQAIGQLLYFFERACGISGYVLGVNPFDQPGVEAYKKNMFALLHKPGFEGLTKELEAKL